MATTQITDAAFKLALAECADAVVSSDWATAHNKLAIAEIINNGLALSAAGPSSSATRRESLAKTAALLLAAEAREKIATDDGHRRINTRMNYR